MSETAPTEKKKRRSSALDPEDLAVLSDLGLKVLSPTKSAALGLIEQELRVARSSGRNRAVWFGYKGLSRPGELNGQTHIKQIDLDVSKATLNAIVADLREDGHRVIPYGKGILIPIRTDDDD